MSRGVGIVVGVGISSFFPLTSSIEEFFLLTIFHLPSYIDSVNNLRCNPRQMPGLQRPHNQADAIIARKYHFRYRYRFG